MEQLLETQLHLNVASFLGVHYLTIMMMLMLMLLVASNPLEMTEYDHGQEQHGYLTVMMMMAYCLTKRPMLLLMVLETSSSMMK